ncbi:MAG: peptidylprolyl isomerase, partial [Kiloniellales bacterium]
EQTAPADPAAAPEEGAPAESAPADSTAAGQPPAEENPVVARVDGEEIRVSDVVASASDLPPQYQAQIQQLFTPILNRLINQKLLSKAAAAEGLGDDPELQLRLEEQKQVLLRELYLQRKVEESITEESLAARYEKFASEFEGEEEARASHILLKTEEEARTVIAQLDGGADFASLAKERSEDPAGRNGGDLGFFTREAMVPEFSEAAFAMEVGTYSKEPVKSQFGWHVIRLEERRTSEVPPLEEVRGQLDEEASREVIQGLVESARSGATIEMVDPETGEPLPPEGAPEAPAGQN